MDQELEAAIDAAGREKVFAVARANGWGSYNPPPKYVWWQIIERLNAGPMTHPLRMQDSRPLLHEQITGLRLW